MRQFAKRQQGMTMIGWVIVLLLIAFFTTIALKVLPIYMENYQIKSILKSFENEAGLSQMSKQDIIKKLGAKFYTSYIDSRVLSFNAEADKDKLIIEKQDKHLMIQIKYEIREHLFFNIDVLVAFDNKYETNFH